MRELRTKGISLYFQVENYIRDKILSNEWPKGYKLLSEPELAKELHVSRSTIRQAISNLAESGLLVRRQGVGTYVADSIYEADFIFNYMPDEFGKMHTLLSKDVQGASSFLSKKLQVPVGTPLYEIKRIRHIKEEAAPALIETSYLQAQQFPRLLEQELSGSVKLYEILRDVYDVQLFYNSVIIEPTVLNDTEAQILERRKGQAALLMTRICSDTQKKPVIVTKIMIRPDKCRIVINDRPM